MPQAQYFCAVPRKLHLTELNRLSSDEYLAANKTRIVVLLDNVRSAGNTGSVFRSADAFRIGEVILGGYTPCPPHRELTKTAIGAEKNVLWRHTDNILAALSELKSQGYLLVALEHTENSMSLEKWDPPHDRLALVFGNEVYGVQQDVLDACDHCIEIPQYGTKHSLNVSVCAGIVMWHASLKFTKMIAV
jgi:23S rRNA (guanosine2251-2'-O)-methyltransferase